VLQKMHAQLRISYTEHVTNDEVLRRVGQDRALTGHVKSRNTKYFRHNSLEKIYHARHHAGHEETGRSKETVAR